jgi:hypothetical protein
MNQVFTISNFGGNHIILKEGDSCYNGQLNFVCVKSMIMDPDRINILIVIKQPPWLSKHDRLFLVISRRTSFGTNVSN